VTFFSFLVLSKYTNPFPPSTYRLRQTDVKAGHFERKVQALESDRDQWEQKYEDMAAKYKTVQKELEDFQAEIGAI
jgi:tropomyosin, fungi type